jgi:formylglycine-generating enzyme required for sulfatase activity
MRNTLIGWQVSLLLSSAIGCYGSSGDGDADDGTRDADPEGPGEAEDELVGEADAADGMVPPEGMVLVPAGMALIGSDVTPWIGDEPMHEVLLSAFWIDEFEVTTGDYARCVEAGACAEPSQAASWSRESP